MVISLIFIVRHCCLDQRQSGYIKYTTINASMKIKKRSHLPKMACWFRLDSNDLFLDFSSDVWAFLFFNPVFKAQTSREGVHTTNCASVDRNIPDSWLLLHLG